MYILNKKQLSQIVGGNGGTTGGHNEGELDPDEDPINGN